MSHSMWKINKERDEHLVIIGSVLIMLGGVLELKGFDWVGFPVAIYGSWVYFWVLRNGKIIKPTKGGLRFFLWVNVSASILAIIHPIGRIFWGW